MNATFPAGSSGTREPRAALRGRCACAPVTLSQRLRLAQQRKSCWEGGGFGYLEGVGVEKTPKWTALQPQAAGGGQLGGDLALLPAVMTLEAWL